MRHFNYNLLKSWMHDSIHAMGASYRPFPGKYPTRIMLRASLVTPNNRPPFYFSSKTFFHYNGVLAKQPFRAYELWKRKYIRQFSGEEFSRLTVTLLEYHQNGILLVGDMNRVTVGPNHSRAHLITGFMPDEIGRRQNRSWTLPQAFKGGLRPVRSGMHNMYAPDSVPLETAVTRIRERQNYVRSL